MALLTVEIPEKLLKKLRRSGRPEQEVIVEALEQTLTPSSHLKRESKREENDVPTHRTEEMSFSDASVPGSIKSKASEPTREEIVAQLVDQGLIPAPGSWDDDYARAWRNRSKEEQRKLIDEMHNTFFPDSFASQLISENRR